LKNKTVNEFRESMNMDIIILDCRTKEEFDSGHIEGSINIPLSMITKSELDRHNIGRDAKIYIICRSGARSLVAAQIIERMGYTEVYNVSGGLLAWDG
jgi:rhodanese-related sulfurtransferase